MADRLYLSCRLRGFHSLRMVGFWEKLLNLFPFSRLSRSPVTMRVHAVDLVEPVAFERGFEVPFVPKDSVEVAREFQQDDCAFLLECGWDLIQFEQNDWKLAAAPVSLWCFGPAFDNDQRDHLRIEFGVEDRFLPVPGDPRSIRAAHANLRSLMSLAGEIQRQLPVDERHLWTESGENLAERLQQLTAEMAAWER